MISYLNLLSGIGMVAVGAAAITYWYLKKRPGIEYFFYGGILWAIAIAIKLIMDLTITQPIQSYLKATLPIVTVVLLMSLYVGLRTGIFESGLTYVVVKYTKLSRMSWNDAVAMGIGFGGTEAILLGLLSLLGMLTYLAVPSLFDQLPPASQVQFEIVFIPIPVIERLFTLFVHVFATVLVIYAVKLDDWRWLALSMGLKTILDGPLITLQYYLSFMGGYALLPIEVYVVAIGIISLAGLFWFGKKYGGRTDAHQA